MFSTTMITVLELEYTWKMDVTFSAHCVGVKGINEVKRSLLFFCRDASVKGNTLISISVTFALTLLHLLIFCYCFNVPI